MLCKWILSGLTTVWYVDQAGSTRSSRSRIEVVVVVESQAEDDRENDDDSCRRECGKHKSLYNSVVHYPFLPSPLTSLSHFPLLCPSSLAGSAFSPRCSFRRIGTKGLGALWKGLNPPREHCGGPFAGKNRVQQLSREHGVGRRGFPCGKARGAGARRGLNGPVQCSRARDAEAEISDRKSVNLAFRNVDGCRPWSGMG